jgi:hypothetical protein
VPSASSAVPWTFGVVSDGFRYQFLVLSGTTVFQSQPYIVALPVDASVEAPSVSVVEGGRRTDDHSACREPSTATATGTPIDLLCDSELRAWLQEHASPMPVGSDAVAAGASTWDAPAVVALEEVVRVIAFLLLSGGRVSS